MSNETPITTPSTSEDLEQLPLPPLPPEIKLPTDKVTVLNVDEMKPNSIVLIKVEAENPVHKMAVAPLFQKLLSPYGPKLREKNITIMLMTTKESLEIISEAEMNRAGWQKKEKSLIINPYQKS